MYGFNVQWHARETLPQIPPDLLFAGASKAVQGTVQLLTPVICWGDSRAYVFDDRVHHQHAWLVVYGDGEHVTGGQQLVDFRHVSAIRELPNGIALELHDASGRTAEISHLQLQGLTGRDRRDAEIEGLPTGMPFFLSDGHDMLAAEDGRAYLAAVPDSLAAQWLFSNGRLTHVATRQVLGLGIRPLPSGRDTGRWHLSPEGRLMYGDGARGLVADDATSEVLLQALDKARLETRWQVMWPGQGRRRKAEGLLVDKLEVRLQVAEDYWAGTSDKIYFSINGGARRQLLAEGFERGTLLRVPVDLAHLMPGRSVFADDLDSIELYQVSMGGTGAQWRMSSLDLRVNDQISNRVLGSASGWLKPAEKANWSGRVNWLDWRHEQDQSPLDYAGLTYPVDWLPMLADWRYWRSYDPSSIDGVCQLIGVSAGHVLAYDLKEKSVVYLKPNTKDDAYTWVYTPQGSIIVKHWDKATSRDQYIRHSQLGAGKPVVCAGELSIGESSSHLAISDLLGMINDASGHYKPDGGACLGHVLERLAQLGFDTRDTQTHSRA
ncbi:hypothetical protein [Pseudomonas sp. NPDC089401]|uniref:hypothetical protein n=1 Tax=Pseudomonas sp. NPDC089401 TaxID=3364462 RepID=UPI0037F29154